MLLCSLTDAVAETALEEERLGGSEESGDTRGIHEDYRPEGGGIAQMLGDDAAQEDAEAHADVPGDEDGGIGRAALVVVRHADGHVLEGGPHVTVAKTDQQG